MTTRYRWELTAVEYECDLKLKTTSRLVISSVFYVTTETLLSAELKFAFQENVARYENATTYNAPFGMKHIKPSGQLIYTYTKTTIPTHQRKRTYN